MSREGGFTLVEALISLAVGLIVLAGVFDVVLRLQGITAARLAQVDVSQRARGVTMLVAREMESAGGSVGDGSSLARHLPAVWPRWIGPVGEDADTVASSERVSVLSIVGRAWPPLSVPSGGSVAPLIYGVPPHCPQNDARCGFVPQELGLVLDARGQFDLFRIDDSSLGRVVPAGSGTRHGYDPAAGARVGTVSLSQYAFDRARRQVRWSNGFSPSLPVADDVVAFEVRYFGERRAPHEPRPPLGVANCLFDTAGGLLDPAAAGESPHIVELPVAVFADGPFCGTAPNRFDVDLLRVRRLRLRARVQVAQDALKGRDARFSTLGWGLAAATTPDIEWSVDVHPANLH